MLKPTFLSRGLIWQSEQREMPISEKIYEKRQYIHIGIAILAATSWRKIQALF